MRLAVACLLAFPLAARAAAPAPVEALRAAPVQALIDTPAQSITVSRAQPGGEPGRALAGYGVSLGAFSALNLAGVLLLSSSRIAVSKGSVSLQGSGPALGAAAGCFLLSPLAAALGSYLVGKGSDDWQPGLGAAALGAYGTSALAVGAGLGLSAAGVDRGAAVAANTALYFAVPLGTVLLQNVLKAPATP